MKRATEQLSNPLTYSIEQSNNNALVAIVLPLNESRRMQTNKQSVCICCVQLHTSNHNNQPTSINGYEEEDEDEKKLDEWAKIPLAKS